MGGVPFSLTTPSVADRVRLRDGNLTQQFTIQAGDRSPWDVAHGSFVDRLELVADPAQFRVPYGTEFEWKFWMLVGSDVGLNGDWQVLAQIHHLALPPSGVGVNPPFAICWNTEGRRGLSVLCRSATASSLLPSGYVQPVVLYSEPEFPQNRWVEIGISLVFSWRGNARAAISRDCKEVAQASGPDFSLGYDWDDNPGGGLYPQFGIYRASALPGNPWKNPDPRPAMVAFSHHRFSVQGKSIT